MALSNETLDLIVQGYTLCDECGDFIDFGGCKHSTPPLSHPDAHEYVPSYPVELYASIGGEVIMDSGKSEGRFS